VRPDSAVVGVGLHPFADPAIADDFSRVSLAIDATEFHVYAANWQPGATSFSVDGRVVKTVGQAPSYPMQLMLGIYELERSDEPGRRAQTRRSSSWTTSAAIGSRTSRHPQVAFGISLDKA
jgi:hypothetical protein